ncbi:MAG: hypothetical protein LBV58_01540 [Acholeplasmatales bacterium]|jgi:hypothetical protein|nr:hypothetical protein [Acholeplasmatales bacterium]
MKVKILSITLILIAIITFNGCKNLKVSDEDIIDKAIARLNIPLEIKDDFKLERKIPVEINNKVYEVIVSYRTDLESITIDDSNNVLVNRPGEFESDEVGNITAIFLYNSSTITKNYAVRVKALEQDKEYILELAFDEIVRELDKGNLRENIELPLSVVIDYKNNLLEIEAYYIVESDPYVSILGDYLVCSSFLDKEDREVELTVFLSYYSFEKEYKYMVLVEKRLLSPFETFINNEIGENIFNDILPYLYSTNFKEDELEENSSNIVKWFSATIYDIEIDFLEDYLKNAETSVPVSFSGNLGYYYINDWVFKASSAESDQEVYLIIIKPLNYIYTDLIVFNPVSVTFPYENLSNVLGFQVSNNNLPAYFSSSYAIFSLTGIISGPRSIASINVEYDELSYNQFINELLEYEYIFYTEFYEATSAICYYSKDKSIYILFELGSLEQNRLELVIFTYKEPIYNEFPLERFNLLLSGYGNKITSLEEFPVPLNSKTLLIDYTYTLVTIDFVMLEWVESDIEIYLDLLSSYPDWVRLFYNGRMQFYNNGWLIYVGYDYVAPYQDIIIEFTYLGDYYGPVDRFNGLLEIYADSFNVDVPNLPYIEESWENIGFQDLTYFSIDLCLTFYNWSENDVADYISKLLESGFVKIIYNGYLFYYDGFWIVQVGYNQFRDNGIWVVEVLDFGYNYETPVGEYNYFPEVEIRDYFMDNYLVSLVDFFNVETTNCDLEFVDDGMYYFALVTIYDKSVIDIINYNKLVRDSGASLGFNENMKLFLYGNGFYIGFRHDTDNVFIIALKKENGTYFPYQKLATLLKIDLDTFKESIPFIFTEDGTMNKFTVFLGDFDLTKYNAYISLLESEPYNYYYVNDKGYYKDGLTYYMNFIYHEISNSTYIIFQSIDQNVLFPYEEVAIYLGVDLDWLIANFIFPNNEMVGYFVYETSDVYLLGYLLDDVISYIDILLDNGFLEVYYGRYLVSYSNGSILISFDLYLEETYISIELDNFPYAGFSHYLGVSIETLTDEIPIISYVLKFEYLSFYHEVFFETNNTNLNDYYLLLEDNGFQRTFYGKYPVSFQNGLYVIGFYLETSINNIVYVFMSIDKYTAPVVGYNALIDYFSVIIGSDAASIIPDFFSDSESIIFNIFNDSLSNYKIGRVFVDYTGYYETVLESIYETLITLEFYYGYVVNLNDTFYIDKDSKLAIKYEIDANDVLVFTFARLDSYTGEIITENKFPFESVSLFLGVSDIFEIIPEIVSYETYNWGVYGISEYEVSLFDWNNTRVRKYIDSIINLGASLILEDLNPLQNRYDLNGIRIYFIRYGSYYDVFLRVSPGIVEDGINLFPVETLEALLGVNSIFSLIPEIFSVDAFYYITINGFFDFILNDWNTDTLVENYLEEVILNGGTIYTYTVNPLTCTYLLNGILIRFVKYNTWDLYIKLESPGIITPPPILS